MRSKVFLTHLQDYIPDILEERLMEGFQALGGIKELSAGKKVFVKINQLANTSPQEAVTTHPLVVEKVVKILLEYGAEIIIGDDIQSEEGRDGFIITGMRDIAQRFGVRLLNLKACPYEKVKREDNKFIKELYIAKPVLEADLVINIPKLKTHSQTILTLAIKNLYGIIPMGERSRYHAVYPRIEDFSEVIVDIFNSCIPSLNIMDGILAMEGEGPQAGTPKRLGFLLVSRDAVAMDSIVAAALGIRPGGVQHISAAASRGLGVGNLKNIDIIGLSLDKARVDDFKLPKVIWQSFVPGPLYKFFYKRITLRPRITTDVCHLCKRCMERCPANAMEIKRGHIVIDYRLCIGCMCCQEICPQRAIKSVRPRSGEMLVRSLKAVQRLSRGRL